MYNISVLKFLLHLLISSCLWSSDIVDLIENLDLDNLFTRHKACFLHSDLCHQIIDFMNGSLYGDFHYVKKNTPQQNLRTCLNNAMALFEKKFIKLAQMNSYEKVTIGFCTDESTSLFYETSLVISQSEGGYIKIRLFKDKSKEASTDIKDFFKKIVSEKSALAKAFLIILYSSHGQPAPCNWWARGVLCAEPHIKKGQSFFLCDILDAFQDPA